jgi:hypothetical protein
LPAFADEPYEINVVRADDFQARSFIKDIIESVVSSYIVIADLTGRNANVFTN